MREDGITLVFLTNSVQVVLVDSADAERILQYRWRLTKKGYAARGRRKVDGPGVASILMHRVILGTPHGEQSDHINRRKVDNRRDNLRVATNSQNQANQALQANNTSGYCGVWWDEHRQCWKAGINSRPYLGSFRTPEEAARAYDAAAREQYGEFAYLNFPEGSH